MMKKNVTKKNGVKKSIAKTLALMLMLSSFSITAFAEETKTAEVYVTISDENGKLALTQEKITVTDIDGDDLLTINDALYVAHEEKYEGGAKAGYESAMSSYGLSLNKLWGIQNGGSYGYCVNNKSAWSLQDEVKEGDYVNAYVYTDLTTWSDTYCYFTMNTISAKEGTEIELILSAAGYDSNYNPITVPVENATITINGEMTDYKTDKDGKVNITINKEGSYVISAVSDTQTLVPPVCKATVLAEDKTEQESESDVVTNENETTTLNENETTTLAKNETTTSTKNEVLSPQTGDNTNIYMVVILMVISLMGITIVSIKRKNIYENEK